MSVAHEVGDLAPDIPLCAPADWRVKTRNWLSNDFYLVRAVETENYWHQIIARDQFRRDAPLLRVIISIENMTQDNLCGALRGGGFERHLAFDSSGQLLTREPPHASLRVTASGETFWMTSEDEQSRFIWQNVHFKHRFDAKWRMRTPDAHIEREVGQMLADPDSDCRFAWTWLHLSQRERDKITTIVARGTLGDVEPLLRATCLSFAPELGGANWRLSLNVGTAAGCEFFARGVAEIAGGSCLQNDNEKRTLSPQHVKLIERILCYFELWRNCRAQTFTVVRELWLGGGCRWQIPFAAPSMHDR